jgi:hypothetical protein
VCQDCCSRQPHGMKQRCKACWKHGLQSVDAVVQTPLKEHALVLILPAKPAPACLSLSNLSKPRFIITHQKATFILQVSRASMTQTRTREFIYPNHQYDFCDPVFVVPILEGGKVEGIWQRADGIWYYRVQGLEQMPFAWWQENQLKPACPRCLCPWDGIVPCGCCGFSTEHSP